MTFGDQKLAAAKVLTPLMGLPSSLLLQGNLLLTGDKDQLVMLLDQINSTFVRSNPSVLQGLLRIIPYLSFGEVEKMQILVERFKPYCSFDKYVGWTSDS